MEEARGHISHQVRSLALPSAAICRRPLLLQATAIMLPRRTTTSTPCLHTAAAPYAPARAGPGKPGGGPPEDINVDVHEDADDEDSADHAKAEKDPAVADPGTGMTRVRLSSPQLSRARMLP